MPFTRNELNISRRRWRLLALFLVFILLISALSSKPEAPSAYVARVDITGMILHSPDQELKFQRIAQDPQIKAVVVYVDSQGGTMTGGLNMYEQLRRIAKAKPLVVYMGTVAASAGYMVALASDDIVANSATLTGSVGVLLPLVDARGLAAKLGIESAEFVSGDKKTSTSPLKARNREENAYLQGTVDQLNEIFVDLVKKRRNMSQSQLAHISDARIIVGRQAQELGMVDHLGDLQTVREILATKYNVAGELPLVAISLEDEKDWLHELMAQSKLYLNQMGSKAPLSIIK